MNDYEINLPFLFPFSFSNCWTSLLICICLGGWSMKNWAKEKLVRKRNWKKDRKRKKKRKEKKNEKMKKWKKKDIDVNLKTEIVGDVGACQKGFLGTVKWWWLWDPKSRR